jgi:hypothetical protein
VEVAGVANLLARKVGFRFEREVKMSYKVGNFYRIRREEWGDNVIPRESVGRPGI